MNRRTSIKNIFALGFLGIFIHNGFSCINGNNKIESLIQLDSYKDLIAELAETIIPATDTPGAKDAKVEDFIIKIMSECEDFKVQERFIIGLENLQEYSLKKYGKNFQKCALEDRISVLEYYENKGFKSRNLHKMENLLFGTSFIDKLKGLTVIGFCTSKIGATEALAYDVIPNHYQGCVLLLPGQKSWATK